MIRYSEVDGAITFDVRVVPRASKTAIVGPHDGALKLRVAAPPVEGAANEELVRFLTRTLDVPRSAVEIVAGQASKSKRVRIAGASVESVLRLAEERRFAILIANSLMRRRPTTPCNRPRIALLSCARLAASQVVCAAADGGR